MARPADWSSLGYSSDPIPGEPTRVDLFGRQYIGTADSIVRAAANLEVALRDDFGQSDAIDAIREAATDVSRRIVKAEDRYRGVGDAMVAYALQLTGAQADSLAALTSADTARTAASSARNMVNYYDQKVNDPETAPANVSSYSDSYDTWDTKLSTAETQLSNAVGALAAAIAQRDRAANTAVAAVEDVENSGDLNDSGWDNIVQWVQENKEIIDLIVDIVGYIATAVMIVALFIPGLNVIVGIVALIATIVTLANVALQVAAGTMGPVEAIMNVALAALTFVGGRAIGSAVNGVQSATRTTVSTSIRASYAGAGIPGMTRAGAMEIVQTATNVSRPGQLALLDRLKFLTLDFRQISQIRNVANIELLSGAHAGGSAAQLAQLGKLGNFGLAMEAGSQVAGQGISAVGNVEQPLPWRLGGNW